MRHISGVFELDDSTKIAGDASGRVGLNIDQTTNLAFTMSKTFAAEDWTNYNTVVFYLNTQSLEHGDLYFYISDSTYGIQDSFSLVLERNAPTINRDTKLNGWREIHVDVAFLGTNGISAEHGLTTPDQAEAEFKRETLRVGESTVLLADRTKFGQVSVWKYGELSAVDVVVTTSHVDEKHIADAQQKASRVILVD